MRPDRVYRTSVLSPMAGYVPGPDVQAVAAAFTSPGLGFAFGTGPIAQWWSGIKARFAARFGGGAMHGLRGIAPGPAYQTAQQIAPQMAAQVSMLAHLAPSRGGGPFLAATDAAMRRWNTYYSAG